MGMYMQLRRCSAARLAELRAQPDLVAEFIQPEDYEGLPEGEVANLDKAWHAIHFLLSGGTDVVQLPQGSLFAGEELGEDFGYGPARVLTPSDVGAFADYLASKPDDFVEQTFNSEALQSADIYPDIWDRGDPEDIEYVAENFRLLKSFIRTAASAGEAVFIQIA